MRVHISRVKEGMEVSEDIYTNSGALVVPKGKKLTTMDLEKLLGFNIKYVNLAISEKEKIKTVDSMTRDGLSETIEGVIGNLGESDLQKVKYEVIQIVESIKKEENFQYDLQPYFNNKKRYDHSVRVACFSIVLSKLHNNRLETLYPSSCSKYLVNLEDVAMAAVFHDIGKSCNKDGQLDKITEIPNIERLAEAFPGIKDTPLDKYDDKYSSVYGYSVLSNIKGISNNSARMVLLSNEPESENGPLKIPFSYNQISLPYMDGAKIIHFCNSFDRAMEEAIEGKKSLEQVATKLAYLVHLGELSGEISQLFINNIPLYPIGTKVKLSTGESAIVRESFVGPNDTYRPIVRVEYSGIEIDLRKPEYSSIIIDSVLSDRERLQKKQIDEVMEELTGKNGGIER